MYLKWKKWKRGRYKGKITNGQRNDLERKESQGNQLYIYI